MRRAASKLAIASGLLLAGLSLACTGAVPPPATDTTLDVRDESIAESASPDVSGCQPLASGLPVFDSYYDVADGARFQATLRYDPQSHDWAVEPQPEILHHHATRIDWSNLDTIGGLGRASGGEVHVTFRFESSEVEKIPDEHAWLSTHVATIETACLP